MSLLRSRLARLDKKDGLSHTGGMEKDKPRLQLNMRVEQDDLDAIDRIRRATIPLPTITEAVLLAIRELDERLAKKAARK